MNRTLLVVDDNKSVRDSLRFLLERRGYEVEVAESGPEALALAAQRPFGGAMIDVNMPGMNGIAVCRALKALAAEKGWPLSIWMMTGARTPDVVKSAQEAGALVVLAKPFDFTDLFRRFDEVLGPVTPPAAPDVLDHL